MPLWRLPVIERPSLPMFSAGGLSGFTEVDLTAKCRCGCPLGMHYFTHPAGEKPCSTCEGCDGFIAAEKSPGFV